MPTIISAVGALALAIQAGQQPIRTAYLDDESHRLVAQARRARFAQDSSLESYEAVGRQRMTVTAAIGAGVRRPAYRAESAFHIRWRDGIGAEVELTGARVGTPIISQPEQDALKQEVRNPDLSPIPYSSGQEPLWPVGGTRGQEDVRIVHPLAAGAEAYYTYESGATTRVDVPNGRRLVLRELKVRPRSPQPNLAVGSLWFDDATGQLVHAGYRLAAPITLNVRTLKTVLGSGSTPGPIAMAIVKGIVSPFKVEISGVAVEYGLYQGRYWLPKARSLEASGQVSFAKVGVEIEQSFTYPAINGPTTLTKVVVNGPRFGSMRAANIRADEAYKDSLNTAPCDSTGYRIVAAQRVDLGLPVAVKYPCDVSVLARSPDFTGQLFGANDDVFSARERDELLGQALPFGAQPAMVFDGLPRPSVQYGLSMTRYNRIEGLSTGIHAEQQLGGGYVLGATGRMGTADRELNGDLSLARTNLTATVTFAGYNRLVSANDWGNPLSFGSSVSALLFGRDEGFYYRASGAELTWLTERGRHLEWRLFAEEERAARQHTSHSWGVPFGPNVDAARGTFAGTSVEWLRATGADPRGLRTITNLRVEAAAGESTYGRGAIDLMLTRPIVGRLSGALSLAGGSSIGALPSQRRWFLGGTQTIRGQSADTAQSGNAFWMTRAELASEQVGYRVALFSDLGWVGDRAAASRVRRRLSGAGVGLSAFDGLIRLDVARGFYPRKQTRLAFYVGGTF